MGRHRGMSEVGGARTGCGEVCWSGEGALAASAASERVMREEEEVRAGMGEGVWAGREKMG